MDQNKYHIVDWTHLRFSTNVQSRVFDCNTIIIVNQGTQNVTVNDNLKLAPGASFTYECYPGEMNQTSYSIIFTNDKVAGAEVAVITKTYRKEGR